MTPKIDTNSVRQLLEEFAKAREVVTYKELTERLAIAPPHSIQQLVQLLEACQEDDAALQQPQIVSVVVQKNGLNCPRSGFFQKLAALGLYQGPDQGPEAQMWHQNELEKAFEFYH
ncbi:hypothetical protein KO489_15010 [Reinekea forsetii]|nr:hypothetical protein [Reinekea forsetii]